MNHYLETMLPIWRRLEIKEANACRTCPGIRDCPNQERGTRQVIGKDIYGDPQLHMRRCHLNVERTPND